MRRFEIKLKGFLGPWGFQTWSLDPESLVDVAKRAFDVPGRTIGDVSTAIERLGRVERSARVREAVRRHWPEPSRLLPGDAPVRRMLET